MTDQTEIQTSPEELEALIQRITRMANVLDSALRIPGTRIRFGLDALIGLIPGIGDLSGLALGSWLIWQARQIQAPTKLQRRMLGNLLIETVIGFVPFLGDAFDVLWQANQRNRSLLLDWLQEQHALLTQPEPSADQASSRSWARNLAIILGLSLVFWLSWRLLGV